MAVWSQSANRSGKKTLESNPLGCHKYFLILCKILWPKKDWVFVLNSPILMCKHHKNAYLMLICTNGCTLKYLREREKVHGTVNNHISLAKWGKVKTIPSTGMKGQRRKSEASSIIHKLIELTQAQQQDHVEIRVKRLTDQRFDLILTFWVRPIILIFIFSASIPPSHNSIRNDKDEVFGPWTDRYEMPGPVTMRATRLGGRTNSCFAGNWTLRLQEFTLEVGWFLYAKKKNW